MREDANITCTRIKEYLVSLLHGRKHVLVK